MAAQILKLRSGSHNTGATTYCDGDVSSATAMLPGLERLQQDALRKDHIDKKLLQLQVSVSVERSSLRV